MCLIFCSVELMAPSPPPAGSAGPALPCPECALPRESICTGSGQAVSGSAIALVGPMYREPLFGYQTSVFADVRRFSRFGRYGTACSGTFAD